jgi:deoxyhypusine synthase
MSLSVWCLCWRRPSPSLTIPRWGDFCQSREAITSYGSYFGAVLNETITWGELTVETPKCLIESDATIVAPLLFASFLAGDEHAVT